MTKSRGILAPRVVWTEDQLADLRRRYPDERTEDIASSLGIKLALVYAKAKKLRLRKSDEFKAGPLSGRMRMGLAKVGESTRFKPGQTPPNKGVRRPGWAPGRMKETQFRKGGRPMQWVPVGTEIVNTEGYRVTKIRDDAPAGQSRFNWKFSHILLWEEYLGPVPPGHMIVFKNNDRTDLRIDNLRCYSRAEHMRRHTFINRYPPELEQLIRANASLKRSITCKERNSNDEEQNGGRARPPVRRTGKPGRPRKADGDRAREGNQ